MSTLTEAKTEHSAEPSSDLLSDLVDAAILAPTPDNNQPWLFAIDGDDLWFYVDPDHALPSDVNSMFDLVGLGAAIENAVIAARHRGFEPLVHYENLTPKSVNGRALRTVAHLSLGGSAEDDPLWPHLAERCTNRKLYSRSSIDTKTLEELSRAASVSSNVEVHWLTSRRQIRTFAGMTAQSDRFRFEYEPFHEEVFRQLRFTRDEVERTRDGLDVRTLELPPGVSWFLQKLRPWPRMRRLQQLGLGRFLTAPSALSVVFSGAIGAITVSRAETAEFLNGGRAFERLWITAQSLGLSLQPLGSLPILLAHVEQLDGKRLVERHCRLSDELGRQFRSMLPETRHRTLLIVFRIGRAKPPTCRSLRRQVVHCQLSILG